MRGHWVTSGLRKLNKHYLKKTIGDVKKCQIE